MIQNLVRGGAAGAAGTTVLNAVTYADMVWRGRASSGAPAQVVDKLAQAVGRPVPGSGDSRDNRLTGLGALSGIAVGCGTGVAVSALRRAGVRMPWWLGGVVTGALAMAATDLPMAGLRVSDPTTWAATDWVSDAVPHLVYGVVTYALVAAGEPRS
ncbi:hypothetical protein OG909_25780 [Streptomyces sp. NBC_01754]|uniref:hypothetical protein n=1 Tax=Streptomyces sp. NBC_01754 TaxID=2975930 RepID=UPI002DD7D8CB|nr:hypothetical protein [Streptomyces sp. NBC_01754]WSC95421.1 hypothetical protein OG909_25780 [Streptomyces sp. NBC_01754]